MRGLTKKIHQKYLIKLEKYIDRLNEDFNPYSNIIRLVSVTLGVETGEFYFYLDYPYNTLIERVNNDLRNSESAIYGLDDKTRKLFMKAKKIGNNPYIYYNYSVSSTNKFYLETTENNIGISSDHKTILNFLPFLNYCCFYESSYTGEVITVPNNTLLPNKQILYLNDSIEEKDGMIHDRFIACTFLVDGNLELEKLEEVSKKLYKNFFFLLQPYFDNPVFEILYENIKKHKTSAYQHTIDNLRLSIKTINLQHSVGRGNLSEIKEDFETFFKSYKALRLHLDELFQVQYLDSRYSDSNGKKHPIHNKTISEAIQYYIENLNIFEVNTSFFAGNLRGVDFLLNGKDKRFYNFILIFWNLWKNACINSKDNKVEINAFKEGENLCISFKAKGEIDEKYLNFLTGKIKKYPDDKKPFKPYRGLQVIRDLCRQHNWICGGVNISQGNKKYSNIIIKIK